MFDNNIVRWYNQNRSKIWRYIIIAIAIIILIRLANYYAGISNRNKYSNIKNNGNTTKDLQTQSIISDTTISAETAKKNNDAIKSFVDYCNSGNTQLAYNMLTEACRKNVYKTLTEFENNYYKKIFTNSRLFSKENWYVDGNVITYRVEYTNNILADGGIKSGENFTDYITVIKENNEYKLNIAKFINEEAINKKYEENNIKIEVISKLIYQDYEVYNINVLNNSGKELKLYDTSLNSTSKWYVEDSSENKINVVANEIIQNYLTLENSQSKNIAAKFMKTYNPQKKTRKMQIENAKLGNENIVIQISL